MTPPLHCCLHDRAELEAFFACSPGAYLYALGDLDPAFWPWTTWYGVRRGVELREVVLVYSGLAQPAVMAFMRRDGDEMVSLLDSLAPLLPPRFHAHLDLRCSGQVASLWRLRPYFSWRRSGVHRVAV